MSLADSSWPVAEAVGVAEVFGVVEVLGVAGMGLGSFVSTNLDNLVVLSAYDVRAGYRPALVRLTFILAVLAVLAGSLLLALAADTLPADQIRYLGLIPMGLGAWQAWRLLPGRGEKHGGEAQEPNSASGAAAYLGFAAVLLANSSDSVSVMTPLLADLRPAFVPICLAAAIAGALGMVGLAHFLARHPASRALIAQAAKWILPFLLFTIGLLIVTDGLPDLFVS